MKLRRTGWIVAILASGAVHAGAAAVILHDRQEDEAKIAGGGAIEMALAGNAFADQVSAGADTSVVEPVTDVQRETTPVEAEATAPEAVEAAAPVPPSDTATPTDITSAQAPAAEAAQPSPTETASMETAKTDRETDIALTRATPARSAQQVPSPAQPAEPVTPSTEAAEPSETVAAPANIPVPTPRPDYEPPRVRKQAPEPQEARKVPASKQTAGSGGRNKADSRRGSASGTSKAQDARLGERRTQTASLGNAEISNYRGKVRRKLSRALRYPAEARRQRLSGEVRVRFVVTANGSVGQISVIRSSGSPVLDNAAVATVKRAAPFPPIPRGAGRSTWSFDTPLAFSR